MKTLFRIVIGLSVLALFGGCTTTTLKKWDAGLPLVTAREVLVEENTPWINLRLKADNVSNTETEVSADTIEYSRAGRVSSAKISITGYKRIKK